MLLDHQEIINVGGRDNRGRDNRGRDNRAGNRVTIRKPREDKKED